MFLNEFEEIDSYQIDDNTFKLIGDDWFLITAGKKESFNTMTAAWGGLGVLWNKKVCFTFIRPTRYTYQYTEKSGFFSLAFFDENYRDALNYCGKKSGKDVDKVKETGLTPLFINDDLISFREARLIITCRKLYHQDIDPAHFADYSIDKNYPLKDYHRMYIGEIIKVYKKK